MALIDIHCPACDIYEEVYRSAAEWPATPPCPKCQGPTVQAHLPRRLSQVDPVVVFRAPDGSFRFPGDPNGRYAKQCQAQGLERVELRGFADVRRFEGTMNAQERSRISRRVERQQAAQAEGERLRRSDFHHGLHAGFQMPEMVENSQGEIVPTGRMKHVSISERTREIARLVMAKNNGKRVRGYEPNFHVEAYSMDRSNREPSRDEQGRRRRD